jgi:hypothetical protein
MIARESCEVAVLVQKLGVVVVCWSGGVGL